MIRLPDTTLQVGDSVSYQDMANPRRVGTVVAILDTKWGRQFQVAFLNDPDEEPEIAYSDCRQHGWNRVEVQA